MNTDVLNAVNSKLAALKLAAEEGSLGKLPYYGVDTTTMPTKQDLVKGDMSGAGKEVRVSPMSMALRAMATGNLPAEVSPSIEGYALPKLEEAIHGKPGKSPRTGPIGDVIKPTEAPVGEGMDRMLRLIKGESSTDKFLNVPNMLNNQDSKLHSLLNSKDDKAKMQRGIARSSVLPDRIPSYIPKDLGTAYSGDYARSSGRMSPNNKAYYDGEFDAVAAKSEAEDRLSKILLNMSGYDRDPFSRDGSGAKSLIP